MLLRKHSHSPSPWLGPVLPVAEVSSLVPALMPICLNSSVLVPKCLTDSSAQVLKCLGSDVFWHVTGHRQNWGWGAQTCQHWEIFKWVIPTTVSLWLGKGPKGHSMRLIGRSRRPRQMCSKHPPPPVKGQWFFTVLATGKGLSWTESVSLDDPGTILAPLRFELASRSCGFCTQMRFWPASGAKVSWQVCWHPLSLVYLGTCKPLKHDSHHCGGLFFTS